MKTIARMMALCLLLGTLSFAQDAPKKGDDKKTDAKAADTKKTDAKAKKGHKGGKKGAEKKADEKPADKK